MSNSYYPDPNPLRADWWQNIIQNQGVLTTNLGWSTTDVDNVARDAQWGVYCYRTAREAFDEMMTAVLAYCDQITGGPDGMFTPAVPTIPAWPTQPTVGAVVGIEERRVKWVERAKNTVGYDPTVGALLGLEGTATPFDPATYQAELSGLASPAACIITGKFRKARGNIDGINLYGRKEGTMPWTLLGRFNASPFSATCGLAAAAPEPWEFLARAVKRDVEIGVASDVVQVIVRG